MPVLEILANSPNCMGRHAKWPQYIGQKINGIEILDIVPKEEVSRKWTKVKCRCHCGEYFDVFLSHLLRGNTKSCGCNQYHSGEFHAQWKGCGEISGQTWNTISRVNQRGHRRDRQNLPFDITIQEAWDLFLKQNRKCALTGVPIYFPKKNYGERTASLDRIDCKKGYVKGNVQWVHKDVNRMKNIFPQEYFIDTCRKVALTYPTEKTCVDGACMI